MERGQGVKAVGLGVVLFAGCVFLQSAPAQASPLRIDNGALVSLSYFLEANGTPIIPQDKKQVMKFIEGKGAYPAAFEKQLIGLKKGDRKEITLTPEQGYGPHLAELVKRIDKKQFPANIPLKEGLLLSAKSGRHAVRIAKVLEDSVVMDENHPLAGKTLTYHIQVTDVSE